MNSFPNPCLRTALFGHFVPPRIGPADLWLAIYDYMKEIKVAKPSYFLSPTSGPRRKYRLSHLDRNMTPQEIADELAHDNEGNAFSIVHRSRIGRQDDQHLFFSQTSGEREVYEQLSFQLDADEGEPPDWSPLVDRLVGLGSPLWLGNKCSPYTAWQCCNMPERYEQFYGSIPAYRRFVQHEDPLLDVSLNPGSNHSNLGMIVRANSELWLGPSFWDFAPCTMEEVLKADFFLEKRETPHYLYLKSWPHPFTRPDGEQGRVQQKLWRLLYKQDCEWPPGSGSICDVPMYGPKELWPEGLEYPYPSGQTS